MFSIIASRVPAEWLICRGLQTEHDNGARECSLGAGCLGADELHASWRSCFIAGGAERPHECAMCAVTGAGALDTAHEVDRDY